MRGGHTADRERFIFIHGLRLRVHVDGSGPPLLLLMGIGGNLDMWQPLRAQLGAFTTIAFDAPGTGASSLPLCPLRMRGLARLSVAVLDRLGFDRVAVLGYSFGGLLAQELTHRAADRVERLVLAATTCGMGAVPGRLSALAGLFTPWRYYSPEHFDAVAPGMFGGRMRDAPDFAPQHVGLRRPPSFIGYAEQVYAATGWSSLPWLHRIAAPTLVLSGDDDPIVPVVNARYLARRIPRAELAIVPGGGHLMLLDNAPGVAPLIERFLAAGVQQG
jgi:poly(3-hydroxyalkanoate) depolymerase